MNGMQPVLLSELRGITVLLPSFLNSMSTDRIAYSRQLIFPIQYGVEPSQVTCRSPDVSSVCTQLY